MFCTVFLKDFYIYAASFPSVLLLETVTLYVFNTLCFYVFSHISPNIFIYVSFISVFLHWYFNIFFILDISILLNVSHCSTAFRVEGKVRISLDEETAHNDNKRCDNKTLLSQFQYEKENQLK